MKKEINKFINKIICGNALEVLKSIEDETIDMVLTSPPYWGLRDYGIEQIFGGDKNCEHEWSIMTGLRKATPGDLPSSKSIIAAKRTNAENRPGKDSNRCLKCGAWKGQLGLEPTPELYIEHMTAVFHEIKRVLKKEGTLWLNIGDTYASSGGAGGDYNPGGLKEGQPKYKQGKVGLPPKCLCMIPERLAWSLIQDGWILRNKIVWNKPNPMPSSVKDRFNNTWEYVYLFAKSKRYYFDLDAVRSSLAESTLNDIRIGCKTGRENKKAHKLVKLGIHGGGGIGDPNKTRAELHNPLGKNPGDFFNINTQPFPEAHFAVFPEKLCEKPIKAGCPEQVCKECGKAKERITEKEYPKFRKTKSRTPKGQNPQGYFSEKRFDDPIINKTIGWTSCDCNAGFEGGILLDPFCGAGTSLYVAKEMRRRYIGIDLKQEYCDMAEKRLAQGVL